MTTERVPFNATIKVKLGPESAFALNGALLFPIGFQRTPLGPPYEFRVTLVWRNTDPIEIEWETRLFQWWRVEHPSKPPSFGPKLGEVYTERKIALQPHQMWASQMGTYNLIRDLPEPAALRVFGKLMPRYLTSAPPSLLFVGLDVRGVLRDGFNRGVCGANGQRPRSGTVPPMGSTCHDRSGHGSQSVDEHSRGEGVVPEPVHAPGSAPGSGEDERDLDGARSYGEPDPCRAQPE